MTTVWQNNGHDTAVIYIHLWHLRFTFVLHLTKVPSSSTQCHSSDWLIPIIDWLIEQVIDSWYLERVLFLSAQKAGCIGQWCPWVTKQRPLKRLNPSLVRFSEIAVGKQLWTGFIKFSSNVLLLGKLILFENFWVKRIRRTPVSLRPKMVTDHVGIVHWTKTGEQVVPNGKLH